MKLSLLICSLVDRSDSLRHLVNDNLFHQASFHTHLIDTRNDSVLSFHKADEVEIIINIDNGEKSTGQKRQELLEAATGEWVIYIDDDDTVPSYYIEELLKATESGADCFAINGCMTTDGQDWIQWFISKDYPDVTVKEGKRRYYRRFTNHITAVKRRIALQAGFPRISNAEDKAYSTGLRGKLHSEYTIEKPMYHYQFSTQNKAYT